MKIAPNTVVTLNATLFDEDGHKLDEEYVKIRYLHGDYEDIFPKVEQALTGKSVGDEIAVDLEPNEHFGEYKEELAQEVPRDVLPDDIKIGSMLEALNAETQEKLLVMVVEMDDEHALLSANHPLAGMTIHFKAKVVNVRAATEKEIAQKHASLQ